jgi:2',3'-cyclic-nucleotide 2'-phosphodiesterase (5'-nucleotidase family)
MIRFRMKVLSSLILASACAVAFCQGNVEKESHLPSQAAADVLRDFAQADGAFLAAGMVKTAFQSDDLATLLQYPTDELVTVGLTGKQIKQAFERSLSLLPQPNTSFLQISGFEVVYSKDETVGQRIVQVRAGSQVVDDGKTYQIAMPSSLGKGALGYFKIWDKTKITKTFENATIESILKGKKFVETSSRWVASGS